MHRLIFHLLYQYFLDEKIYMASIEKNVKSFFGCDLKRWGELPFRGPFVIPAASFESRGGQ